MVSEELGFVRFFEDSGMIVVGMSKVADDPVI